MSSTYTLTFAPLSVHTYLSARGRLFCFFSASCLSPLWKLLCDASGDLQQPAARLKWNSVALVEMLRSQQTYWKETAAEAGSADRPNTAAATQNKASAKLQPDQCIDLICVTLVNPSWVLLCSLGERMKRSKRQTDQSSGLLHIL